MCKLIIGLRHYKAKIYMKKKEEESLFPYKSKSWANL